MLQSVLKNQWIQALGAVLLACLLLFLCYVLSPVLVPLFFAFLVAYMLNPVVDFFERWRVRRTITVSVMAITATILVILLPLLLIPSLINQSEKLISAAADKASTGAVAERANYLVGKLPLKEMVRYVEWVPEGATDDFDPLQVIAQHIGMYVKENALSLLRSYGPHVAVAGSTASSAAAAFFGSVSRFTIGAVSFLAHFALFAFVAGYLLRDFHRLLSYTETLVPPRNRKHLFEIVGKINEQLHGFLRGQMLVCLFLGLMYATGFFIAGTPFGIIIGLLGGVASFVPYLGLMLTLLPATILTVLQHGFDWHVVAVLATFAVAHLLEGSFLTPKIVGEQVGLNPVWVILAILVFASLLGFLGLLMAVPIAAVMKVLVVDALDHYRKSPLFSAEGDPTSIDPEA